MEREGEAVVCWGDVNERRKEGRKGYGRKGGRGG